MSTYKEIKRDFLLDLARSAGFTWKFGRYPELAAAGTVPERLFERWVKRFYKQVPVTLSDTPRLVNHFKLGADPEFVFIQEGKVAHATQLGLKAGLAIGADNNGRLAELRPAPSRFALEVVASMYAEFCFLAQWNPGLTKLSWIAQPFVERDGLGGHIHFGRWGKMRAKESSALDTVMVLLERAGCISRIHQRDRIATKLYGRYGDIRPQAHGYEYRTFPTWVACPKHAHLYLTLAKLAVFNPGMFEMFVGEHAAQTIKNILHYYANLDDDARIALCYLNKCWHPPVGDIQKAWNVFPIFQNAGCLETDIIPPTIAPKAAHIKSMFDYLTTGVWLPVKETFEPLRFPEGFKPFQSVLITDRRPELGELVWDMALVPMKYKMTSPGVHQPPDVTLRVSPLLYGMIKEKLHGGRFRTPDGVVCVVSQIIGPDQITISFPIWLLNKRYKKWLKKFLTEDGIFPFVKLGQLYTPRVWKVREDEKLILRA